MIVIIETCGVRGGFVELRHCCSSENQNSDDYPEPIDEDDDDDDVEYYDDDDNPSSIGEDAGGIVIDNEYIDYDANDGIVDFDDTLNLKMMS